MLDALKLARNLLRYILTPLIPTSLSPSHSHHNHNLPLPCPCSLKFTLSSSCLDSYCTVFRPLTSLTPISFSTRMGQREICRKRTMTTYPCQVVNPSFTPISLTVKLGQCEICRKLTMTTYPCQPLSHTISISTKLWAAGKFFYDDSSDNFLLNDIMALSLKLSQVPNSDVK